MKKIGLIGCSKSKLGKNTPNELFRAQDIYQGNSFKKSKTEGLKRFECEDFYILSARHKLLNKDEEICYYDDSLNNKKVAYKKDWADKVLECLKCKFDLTQVKFYIFAGENYYKYLVPHLNCVAFGYKNSNCIDFDKQTEHEKGGK